MSSKRFKIYISETGTDSWDFLRNIQISSNIEFSMNKMQNGDAALSGKFCAFYKS